MSSLYELTRAMPYGKLVVTKPVVCEATGLWFYGDLRLLTMNLEHVELALGPPGHTHRQLLEIESEARRIVDSGRILVCGIHNFAHRRAAVVPLRYNAPRIVVMTGGFHFHLGADLQREPFRMCRVWRSRWQPDTDLAVSRRSPDEGSTLESHDLHVNELIRLIATKRLSF